MQICPAALSPPGLSICSFSLVFCQLDSQSIFLLDLEAAWLPDPKAQDHLDSSFIQLLKSPFKKQEPALTLPYLLGTQVSFLIISHPGSTAPAPPVGQIPVALASGWCPQGTCLLFTSCWVGCSHSFFASGRLWNVQSLDWNSGSVVMTSASPLTSLSLSFLII